MVALIKKNHLAAIISMIILFKGSFFLDIFETINEISTPHIVDKFSLCVIQDIQPYVFFEFFFLLNIKRSKNISVSIPLLVFLENISVF